MFSSRNANTMAIWVHHHIFSKQITPTYFVPVDDESGVESGSTGDKNER